MTKRRADDSLHDGPRKRDYRPLCGVEMKLESMSASGCVGPPSLLALLGGRCRKRTCYFDEPVGQETSPSHKAADGDIWSRAPNGLLMQHSGTFHDRRSSSTCLGSKKRHREECVLPQQAFSPAGDGAPVKCDSENEECIYNTFQYWRTPLPELDLSLLEEISNQSEPKEKPKLKDSSSDLMET